MGQVIKLDGEHMQAWDVSYTTLFQDQTGAIQKEDLDSLKELLDQGYEPFAVCPTIRIVSPSKVLSGSGQPQQIMGEKIWLKRCSLKKIEKDTPPQIA